MPGRILLWRWITWTSKFWAKFADASPRNIEPYFAEISDSGCTTLQVWYSAGNDALQAVTRPLAKDNSGGGQFQLGMAKKTTEAVTVVYGGYHESNIHEGQIYGGIFIEDSIGGCISK
jgi:hypothetical protein